MKLIKIVIILSFFLLFVSPIVNSTNSLSNDVNNVSYKTTNDEVIYQGQLQRMDSAHWGEGTVLVIRNSSGSLLLSFQSDVIIASGPGLYVYLSKTPSFSSTGDSPGEYIDLGKLPQQTGPFNMTLPDLEISSYKSIIIWCDPFSAVFSFATFSEYNSNEESTQTNTTSTSINSTHSDKSQSNPENTTNGFMVFSLISLLIFILIKRRQK